MKKSNLIIKSLTVIMALFIVSCNDDNSMDCPQTLLGPLSALETRFSGTWKLTGMLAEEAVDITDDGEDNPSKDIFSQYTECQRDLVYNFNSDRNYIFKQGYSDSGCNPRYELSGTWNLSEENFLTFVANCTLETIQISLNDAGNTFWFESPMEYKDESGLIKSTKVIFTYKKGGIDITPHTN